MDASKDSVAARVKHPHASGCLFWGLIVFLVEKGDCNPSNSADKGENSTAINDRHLQVVSRVVGGEAQVGDGVYAVKVTQADGSRNAENSLFLLHLRGPFESLFVGLFVGLCGSLGGRG